MTSAEQTRALIVYILFVIVAVVGGIARGTERAAEQVMINSPGGIQVGDGLLEGNIQALVAYRTGGVEECRIAPDLRVHGDRRARCVEHLERAARLARAEMRVNERGGRR